MSSIKTAFQASQDMQSGPSVLSRDEWLRLCAFTDQAIYFKPTTEKMLRDEIRLPFSEPLLPEFLDTIRKYVRLKQYCQTFEDKINPGTRDLAADIVRYARATASTYDALIRAIQESAGGAVSIGSEKALEELSRQWRSSHPSPQALKAKNDFVKYIGVLKQDAEKRAATANELHGEMKVFHKNLKASNSEFVTDARNYEKLFGALNPRVQKLKADLDLIQLQLNQMRKQEGDMVIVLETAPLYLAIPLFGPFFMSGVLLGVGGALANLRNQIYTKIQEAEAINNELGPQLKFMALYKHGQDSTGATAKEIEAVLPLVERLKNAWATLTSDLNDLSRRLLADASQNSLTGDWDVANLRLETAKTTWQDLKIQAQQYLQFQIGRAEDLEEVMNGALPKAA
jgi:hypothetical protein